MYFESIAFMPVAVIVSYSFSSVVIRQQSLSVGSVYGTLHLTKVMV